MVLASQIGIVLHPIGITCSILVLLSIIVLAIINRQLANRMTVRLIAAIAFADLLSHSVELYSAKNSRITLGSAHCISVNAIRLFGRTFYSFTNIAICFHLYRSLVLLKRPTWRNELYTWITTFVAVVLFTLIYWALGALSGVQRKVGCNPGADDKTLNSIFYFLAGFVDISTVIICVFTTVVGHRSLNKWINTYAGSRSYQGQDQDKFKKDRKKMAERSFLYPLSTCITLPIEAIFLILNAFNIFVIQITLPMAVTIGLSGLLTGLAFAIDPAAHKAFASAYAQIKNRKYASKNISDNISESTISIPLTRKF